MLLLLFSCLVQSNSLRPHELLPVSLLSPWDFPGENTRVVTISFSRGSSWPMDGTPSPTLAGGFFTTEPPGKPLTMCITVYIKMLSALRASLVAQLVKNPPAMLETWVWSLGWEDSLEKGTATHSSILVWRIPWTVESMGSQRVNVTEWLSLSVLSTCLGISSINRWWKLIFGNLARIHSNIWKWIVQVLWIQIFSILGHIRL